eukprot:TRINITY_DN8256_c0_g1_i3.p1 TRINITY_DN8256_c0_g1~~TRINITY_DN8256_c0_g1_i3.p1  ORF type:complete len:141 (-),score=28.33 TRINITY_DN8256_c0_g1_i3:87-509(-)
MCIRDRYMGIQFVINLENSLSQGNLTNVINCKQQATLPHFHAFLDRIMETIRYQVARNSEKAYKSLQIQEAMSIFGLLNQNELISYVEKQNELIEDTNIRWMLEDNKLIFQSDEKKMNMLNSELIISNMFNYANEIEKII